MPCIQKKKGLPCNIIRAIAEDTQGTIWIGTTQGLAAITNKQLISFPQHTKYGSGFIQDLIVDSNGILWIIMNNNKIYQYDGTTFTNFEEFSNKEITSIQSIFEDNNANIWFGTTSGDIYQYNPKHHLLTKKWC